MKSQGSIYVAIVFAALFGYFGYQWWYNPAPANDAALGITMVNHRDLHTHSG